MSKCERKVVKKIARETKKLIRSLCLQTEPTKFGHSIQSHGPSTWTAITHILYIFGSARDLGPWH